MDERYDAINFALPYLAILGLVAALFALWRRRGRRLLPLACIGGILAASAPLLLGEWPAAARPCGGPTLRLIQFNTFKANFDVPATTRWLRLSGADVIVLEEAAHIALSLADIYPWRQSCAGGGGCSTIILSRVPPIASDGAARGDPENRGGLSAAWMRLPFRGGAFTIVGVHLGRPWPFRRFHGERRQLATLVASEDRASTVVAGDFNLPGWTFQMRQLEAALGLTRLTRGLPTWPARLLGRPWRAPLIGIDQVLAGRAWRVAHIATGPALGSDHHPVMIELERCPAS